MNISGPAAVAKPEMLFYAPGDLTVTMSTNVRMDFCLSKQIWEILQQMCWLLRYLSKSF